MLAPFDLGQGIIFDARGVILAFAPVLGSLDAVALPKEAILACLG